MTTGSCGTRNVIEEDEEGDGGMTDTLNELLKKARTDASRREIVGMGRTVATVLRFMQWPLSFGDKLEALYWKCHNPACRSPQRTKENTQEENVETPESETPSEESSEEKVDDNSESEETSENDSSDSSEESE